MLKNFKTNQFKATQSGFFGGSEAHKMLVSYLKKKVLFINHIRLYSQNQKLIEEISRLDNVNPNLKIEVFSRIAYSDTNKIADNFFKFYQLQKWYNLKKKQIVILDNQFINTNSSDPLLQLLTTIIEDKWLNMQLIFVHQKVNQLNHRLSRSLDHYFINRYQKKNKEEKEKYDMCSLVRHFRFNHNNRIIEDKTKTLYFNKDKTIKHCDQFLITSF